MKKPLLFFLLSFSYAYVSAQLNAWATSAPLLTVGSTCTTTSGSMANMTLDVNATSACPGTVRYDGWYRFVATSNSITINMTVTGANFTSPGLQVLNNGNTGGTSYGCGTTSVSPTGLTTGNTYYIRVFSTTTGSIPTSNAGFDICVVNNAISANAYPLPVNTNCVNTSNQTLFNANATAGLAGDYAENGTYDNWYKFTMPIDKSTVLVSLSGYGSNLSSGATFIEAYNASTSAAVSAATSIGTSNGGGLTISDLTPGGTYIFRVYTASNPTSGAAGNWAYNVCISVPAIPGNNECSGATALTIGTLTQGSVSNATASSGIPAPCSGTPDDDVWYSFVASGTVANVNVNPGTTLAWAGPMIQVLSRTGACTGLAQVGCGKSSVYLTGLTNGATYYVRVFSAAAAGTPSAGPLVKGSTSTYDQRGGSFIITVTIPSTTIVGSGRMKEIYQQSVISGPEMLNDPWEITYGPDGFLWITEAKGYRVYRMNPSTGARTTVLDLSRRSEFFTTAADKAFNIQFDHYALGGQGGMAGLAIHPSFMAPSNAKNYVYVSYIHSYHETKSGSQGAIFTNQIVRFTYNTGTGRLESPESLCDTIPGSSDHNSQRMIIAPVAVGGPSYLFYAAGDMGSGQFANQWRPQHAQVPGAYEGKILRFNLEADAGDPNDYTKWIPNDNPSASSAVWAIGIRNNQGFAYNVPLNILYGSSHGPYSDDEINIIEKSANYGHPLVIGYKNDGNYNSISAGDKNGSTCPIITSELTNANNIGTSYRDPLFSGYADPATGGSGSVRYSYDNSPGGNGVWPSEAWSGMELYTNTVVPGWKNSLVLSSLKWGRILRVKLEPNGAAVAKTENRDTISYFGGINRFRDIAFDPNGKDMYVIMDRSTSTSGPSSANPVVPSCPGCIQKYSFVGYANASGKSDIPKSIDISTGAANSCNTGTPVTINSANNNYWVPITGPDGNIVAEIKANGQNIGTVTSSYYTNSGAIRQKGIKRYLDRSITLNISPQPASAVSIRFYITGAEFNAFRSAVPSVTTITQMNILRNNDGCGPSMVRSANSVTQTVLTAIESAHDTTGFVLQADVAALNASTTFYFTDQLQILPVNLITFTGALENNSTQLKWKTSSETNTSHFSVERSTDGISFNAIGTVSANGNTTSESSYSFADHDVTNLQSNNVYYRLKIVDFDGKTNYSDVVTISLIYITGRVSLAPNPASIETNVTITMAANGKVKWNLVDNAGHTVLSSAIELKKGVNTFPINVNKLAAGAYYLQVKGPGVDRNVKLQKL